MRRPHGIPDGGEFRLPESDPLYLVLVVDPHEGEAHEDIHCVCDDAHLDGVIEHLRDVGVFPENIRVQDCVPNEPIDWAA